MQILIGGILLRIPPIDSGNKNGWHADACIGKGAQFHAERTDREPQGRPVARYSGVLVFYVVKSHADASIGRRAQFHAERTDRELQGRPVARYSGVLVFYVVKSHTYASICELSLIHI